MTPGDALNFWGMIIAAILGVLGAAIVGGILRDFTTSYPAGWKCGPPSPSSCYR